MLLNAKEYEGDEPYVFISYCRANLDLCDQVLKTLTQGKIRFWYDNQINPGENWIDTIADHLARSHVCISIVTPEFINSYNCNKELAFVKERGIPAIPILIEDVKMTLGMELMFAGRQHIRVKEGGRWDYSAVLNADLIQECRVGEESGMTSRETEFLALNLDCGTGCVCRPFAGCFEWNQDKGYVPKTSSTDAEYAFSVAEENGNLLLKNLGRKLLYLDYFPVFPQKSAVLGERQILMDGKNRLLLCSGDVCEKFKGRQEIAALTCEDTGESVFLLDDSTELGSEYSWRSGALDDELTEKRHCTLTCGEKYLLTDLGSASGTFLNCRYVSRDCPAELHSGDLIQIGRTLLRFTVLSYVLQ